MVLTVLTVEGYHWRPPCAVGMPSASSCRANSASPRPRVYSRQIRSTTRRGRRKQAARHAAFAGLARRLEVLAEEALELSDRNKLSSRSRVKIRRAL
jgi:hypothetical protein